MLVKTFSSLSYYTYKDWCLGGLGSPNIVSLLRKEKLSVNQWVTCKLAAGASWQAKHMPLKPRSANLQSERAEPTLRFHLLPTLRPAPERQRDVWAGLAVTECRCLVQLHCCLGAQATIGQCHQCSLARNGDIATLHYTMRCWLTWLPKHPAQERPAVADCPSLLAALPDVAETMRYDTIRIAVCCHACAACRQHHALATIRTCDQTAPQKGRAFQVALILFSIFQIRGVVGGFVGKRYFRLSYPCMS